MFAPAITRVLPLTSIRRERILPVPGEVLVSAGERVDPFKEVARAEIPGRYHMLDLARIFKVSPKKADSYVRRKKGEFIEKGQVIALRRGLIARTVRTPVDAELVDFGGGRVLLKSAGEQVKLLAYLPGTVTNILPKKGVLVETTGALVQGRWGAGGESFGVLKVLVENPKAPLRAAAIDIICHGAVLVGGSTMDADALAQAQEMQVKGIIIGSLPLSLIEAVQKMDFPVIATEGIGRYPMAAPIFRILKTNAGREAVISGKMQTEQETLRPEIVIPLPADSRPPYPTAPDAPLAPGDVVRIARGAHRGQVAAVKRVVEQAQLLENGINLRGVMVTLEDGADEFVPFFNLELLG